MGDDAELYWEMEHNPYFWDEVESCSRNNSFTENKSKKKKKTIQTKSNSTRKKVNAALFIDGENISSKKAEQNQKIANKQGVLGTEKVYGLQKDECTKSWSDKAKKLDIKDIRLCGNPEKDKVDNKIKKDVNREIKNNKSVDVVCIATSDKGYTDTVKELRRQGKKVVGIGEKKAPKELRDACSEFFEIK